MPSLSVIMIVKDEAGCLPQCLESVRGIADELVIADTGSTDDTVAIARRFGAKVFHIPWEDDFASARNRTIAAASGDWLLHMDADELLDPAGAKRIRHVVDNDGFGADAVEVILANYCDDPRAWRWVPVEPGSPWARGHAGYIRAGLLRLFRNGAGFEYGEPVHENITASVLEKGGRIRREDAVIHHYGFDLKESRTGGKARLYLRIARRKLEKRPDDTKALHDFAEQALACNLTEEAEQACRRALAVDPQHLGAASTLANILLNRGGLGEARALFEGLEQVGIAPPHVATTLGAIACREGRLEEARSRLETVCADEPRSAMARLYLARVYDLLGETEKARRELDVARGIVVGIREFDDRVRAHERRTQGEALYQAGSLAQALECLVEALRLDAEDPLTHNDVGVVLEALGQEAKARESFERALSLAPGFPGAKANLRALNSLGADSSSGQS